MPPASSESQFTFLISCIRYSNNGKVDFTEVANECGIVSKGAAAKRYERMMKAHGIYQGSQPIRETTIASRPSKRTVDSASDSKSGSGSGLKSKKRKQDQFNEANNTDTGDDDEGLQKVKPEPIKSDPDESVIKEEPTAAEEHSPAYSEKHMANGYQPDETSFFNDFIHPGAFDQEVLQDPGAFHQPTMPCQSEYMGAFTSDGYQGLGSGPADACGNEAVHDSIVIGD